MKELPNYVPKELNGRPVLHLNLHKKWFDMISRGEKPEEYRKHSPYWNRIFSAHIRIKGRYYHPTDVLVCFSNGYRPDRPQFFATVKALRSSEGKPEWGAQPGGWYHTLFLDQIFLPPK